MSNQLFDVNDIPAMGQGSLWDLPRYAREIKSLNDEAAAIEATACMKAREAGALLNEAKPKVDHGKWLEFVESTGISRGTAAGYMRLANANVQRVAHLSIRAALKEIAGPPKPATPVQQPQEAPDEDAGGEGEAKPLSSPSEIIMDLRDAQEEMAKIALKDAIKSLPQGDKGKVTRLFNAAVKKAVYDEVAETVRVKEVQLNNAIRKYGDRIDGKLEDIKRVRSCLHPDSTRTQVQLNNAFQAFQRLLGEAS